MKKSNSSSNLLVKSSAIPFLSLSLNDSKFTSYELFIIPPYDFS